MNPDMNPDANPARPGRRQQVIIGSVVAGVLALIGVAIWVLFTTLSSKPAPVASGPAPLESRPPLPLELEAKDFRVGDCFPDFDPDSSKATAVPCETGHSAQLAAVDYYQQDQSFPGREDLKKRTLDICKAATLNDKQNDYALTYQLVYPSSTSWEKGDRRVDCFVTTSNGNTITADLLRK